MIDVQRSHRLSCINKNKSVNFEPVAVISVGVAQYSSS